MKKNTWELRRYSCGDNDSRVEVVVKAGTAWIVSVTANGSGMELHTRTAGQCWREGSDELVGVFATEADAVAAMG